MRLRKDLYGIGTGVVVCSLLAVGLAGWRYSGIARAASVCCVLGAVGVVWFSWYRLKLIEAIASVARRLKENDIMDSHFCRNGKKKRRSDAILSELSEAINSHIGNATELEKQMEDLQLQNQLSQRQKRNAEAIIYSIRDAVVVDEFDKMLMANEAAEKLFKFDFKASKHKPISEVIDADKGEFVETLRSCRRSKARHTRREMEFLVDDKPRTFDCIFSCVHGDREQVCGIVAVLHDITREKEISQMKNDFVSHVSHELKTPLASITAYSEMLMDGEADDEQTRKEFYTIIQNQAKRLNRLIENILNISRIESGLIKVEKKPISLPILIEEQLRMIKSYAEEKNIEIIKPEGKDVIVFGQVYADEDMISQVIVNLLSNAVKYTNPGGSIRIESEVCTDQKSRDIMRVSVTDTGVGIPEDEIEHVFDKFYRVAANKKQAKGTGLGLNLVKQIVEKVHDGLVFVTSQVGAGSTFGFELPLATAEVVESSR